MMKSLKWSSSKSSQERKSSQEPKDDHPMTVEFTQEIASHEGMNHQQAGSESTMNTHKSNNGNSDDGTAMYHIAVKPEGTTDQEFSDFLQYLGTSSSSKDKDGGAVGVESSLQQKQPSSSLTRANNTKQWQPNSVNRSVSPHHHQARASLPTGLMRIPESHSCDNSRDNNNIKNSNEVRQVKDLSSLRSKNNEDEDSGSDDADSDGFARSRYSTRPSVLTSEVSSSDSHHQSSNTSNNKRKRMRRPSDFFDGGGDRGSASNLSTGRGGGGPSLGASQGGPNRRTTSDEQQEYNVRAAFEKEHKAVRKFKIVVVLLLVAAATAVSGTVYRFTSRGESDTLVTEYNDYADKFITNFHHVQVLRQWAAYTVAAMFTARCVNNVGPENPPWPNITLADFSNQVRGALVLAHGNNIEFSPIFQNNETIRKQWEAYAAANKDTIMHVPAWAMGHQGHDSGHGEDSSHGGSVSNGHDSHGSKDPNHATEGDSSHGHVSEELTHAKEDVGHEDLSHNATEGDFSHSHGGSNSEEGVSTHDVMSTMVDEEMSGPDTSHSMHDALADSEVIASEGIRLLRGGRRVSTTGNVFDGANSDHTHEDEANKVGSDHGGNNGSSSNCTSINQSGQHHHGEHPIRPIEEGIYTMNGMSMVDEIYSSEEMSYVAPKWHIFPLSGNEGRVMYNEYSDCHRRRAINTMLATDEPAITEVLLGAVDFHHYYEEPSSIIFYPVHDSFDEEKGNIVGFISIAFSWMGMFWNILPENVKGIVAVVETSTGQTTSFQVDGKFAHFLGEGDLHDKKWDHMKKSSSVHHVYASGGGVEIAGHHLLRRLEEMGEGHTTHSTDNEENNDGVHIDYYIHIYPSDDFQACYLTNQPKIFSVAVSMVFLVTAFSFIVYDFLVERRQKKLLHDAERSGKVVASLFPAMVRDRLFDHTVNKDEERTTAKRSNFASSALKNSKFMVSHHNSQQSQSGDSESYISGSSPPIADLYNNTTVLFADIAGFTAWSSEREPTQVFQLLESLFCEFDSEAKIMKVYKIETIGDCYVAVTGLPLPDPKHASIMAKFAQRCLMRFSELTKELELSLGPGTADLGIRIGLHSGPVTAGVLRGEKARFQLFGDTMNTASRMESTSIKNMIQVSADTAKLLQESGKGHTLIAREGLVKAKGKGYMQTYWLRPKTSPSSVSSNFSENNLDALQASQHEVDHIHSRALHDVARSELGLPSFSHQLLSDKGSSQLYVQPELEMYSWNDTGFSDINKNDRQEGLQRLIKWNTAVLEPILTKVVIQRNEKQKRGSFKASNNGAVQYNDSALFHEEIALAVEMPRFDRESMSDACLMPSKEKVNLIPPKAREELRAYVGRIASMYHDVHFHNFEHASHVTMSAQKLINKVVLRNSPEFGGTGLKKVAEEKKDNEAMQEKVEADLFFSTYGISADPLAQFAIVFSALIHDSDHRGVPNVQLIKEKPTLASKYKNKSIAENNSIRVAWSELLKPEFANLRRCLFGSSEDEIRFRQLLINVVIATDITDRERRATERERWDEAFGSDSHDSFNWEREWQNKAYDQLPDIDVSLKATVVLEQILLASDVAHTMQHWLTYVKWNERLYKEMWAAYTSGRAENDPTEGWYKGEIGFFDGYIIPLATKLKECGVFGSAGDEYLGNALRNKAEWIEKGMAIVDEFEAKIKRKSNNRSLAASTTSEFGSSSSSVINEINIL